MHTATKALSETARLDIQSVRVLQNHGALRIAVLLPKRQESFASILSTDAQVLAKFHKVLALLGKYVPITPLKNEATHHKPWGDTQHGTEGATAALHCIIF